jgi:hypothetical protein
MKTRNIHLCISIVILGLALLACSFGELAITPTPTLTLSPTHTAQSPAPTPAPTLPAPPTDAPPRATQPAPEATSPAPTVSQVTFYLVALEDNGAGGIQVGCGDSLVALTQPVDPTDQGVKAALERLFSYKTQFIGESGLYTALYQSDLQVDSVDTGPAGDVTVALSGTVLLGGVCDGPRFQGQIEQTIKQMSGASAVNVTINGKPLRDYVSGR